MIDGVVIKEECRIGRCGSRANRLRINGVLRNSRILDKYRLNGSILQQTKRMEFASKYNDMEIAGEFRAVFVLYLRNLARILEIEMGVKKRAAQNNMAILGKCKNSKNGAGYD